MFASKYAAIMEDMPFVLLGLFDDLGPLASSISYDIVHTKALDSEFWDSTLDVLDQDITKYV